MFSFFQDIQSADDSIITLDTVNKKLQNKRKQSLVLACFSLFFLGNGYLIDSAINFLVKNIALNSQLGIGVYLIVAILALYSILNIVQETSNLISQRDEINKLLA